MYIHGILCSTTVLGITYSRYSMFSVLHILGILTDSPLPPQRDQSEPRHLIALKIS